MNKEFIRGAVAGGVAFVALLAIVVLTIVAFVHGVREHHLPTILGAVVIFTLTLVCANGFIVVNPNEGHVVQLFGTYTGTLKTPGIWFVNPLSTHRRVSLRVRNFETPKLKVNDHDGNPIEIAAVVVWKVVDTAEAVFEVDSYENFVNVQSESALRNLATLHPYDAHEDGQMALRSHPQETAERLRGEIQDRLTKAGVEVIEARISHLAYAQEIASVMLQRQAASAIIAARSRIVDGAVGMVEMALAKLSERNVVQLDDERRAAMVSNLLVVLCSDKHAQPVVNTGTLYS